MNWNLLQSLLDEPDNHLTKNGLDLKRLARRMSNNVEYELNENDKEILDQKWRKIWKDKVDEN